MAVSSRLPRGVVMNTPPDQCGAKYARCWTCRQVGVNVCRHPRVTHPSKSFEGGAMPGRVEGKGIVITGAGSGIGRAFALGLAREGASVGVLDVNADAARAVADAINAGDAPKAMALSADVRKRAEVAQALDTFIEHVGGLDVVFNNAGFNRPMHMIDVTEE